jgi:hypothetical protein
MNLIKKIATGKSVLDNDKQKSHGSAYSGTTNMHRHDPKPPMEIALRDIEVDARSQSSSSAIAKQIYEKKISGNSVATLTEEESNAIAILLRKWIEKRLAMKRSSNQADDIIYIAIAMAQHACRSSNAMVRRQVAMLADFLDSIGDDRGLEVRRLLHEREQKMHLNQSKKYGFPKTGKETESS